MARRRGKRGSRKQRVSRPRTGQARRPQRRSIGRGRSGQVRISRMSPSYDLACSWANPWECSACIPDGASGVGCFSVKQVATLGTGLGGGACGFYWNPSIQSQSFVDSGSTANVATTTGSYSSAVQKNSITALYSTFRPVSAGVRATFIGNTQTDQGIILIGQLPADFPLVNLTANNLTNCQAQFQNYKLFPLRSGGQVSWRPETMNDNDTWYTTAGSAVATTVSPVAPQICILAFNAYSTTASTCLLIDAVCNYEGQYTSQTFMPGGLMEEPKLAEPGWFEKAKNMVRSVEAIIPFAANAIGTYLNKPGLGNAIGALASSMKSGLPVSDSRYVGRIQEI